MAARKQGEETTSANIQPCKVASAEDHILRRTDQDYFRHDLQYKNDYQVYESIEVRMATIHRVYLEVTGQKIQSHAKPIREIVVTYLGTRVQALAFEEGLKGMGFSVLSWAIHHDEGHNDVLTNEWIPNIHAHFIVDITQWTHDSVLRAVKSNGRYVVDPEIGKTKRKQIDGYGHAMKLTKAKLSALQDLASKVTGYPRGNTSSIKHLKSIEYKIRQKQEDYRRLSVAVEKATKQLRKAVRSSKSVAQKTIAFARESRSKCEILGIPYPEGADAIVSRLQDSNNVDESQMSSSELMSCLELMNEDMNRLIPLLISLIIIEISETEERQLKQIITEYAAIKAKNAELERQVNRIPDIERDKIEAQDMLGDMLSAYEELQNACSSFVRNVFMKCNGEEISFVRSLGLDKLVQQQDKLNGLSKMQSKGDGLGKGVGK